jgi:peptidyl-prolyl cis-trans isomerase D
MLQTIRDRAQGWIAWVIVILISIPFALWGIQSYLGVGAEPVVATVNGTDITERQLNDNYRGVMARLREQLGSAYRPELFKDKETRARVLENMIRDNLVAQTSQDLGLRASDPEIRAAIMTNPAFQKNGAFDNATYERMLQLQGMSSLQYEDSLRQRIVGSQLPRTVVATEILTEKELEEAVRLERQKRRLSYVRVPRSAFSSDEPVSDQEISGYYESQRSQFRTPERVKVRYLVLDADSVASKKVPGDEELRGLYEAGKDRFTQPERRHVRHILIALDPKADQAVQDAAKEKITQIRKRIDGGEDFASLAKELSEDPGSAGQGGDLGLIEQGVMDPAFDKAAFSLEVGQVSGPVRSPFGYHLIEVTEIEPKVTEPFEKVKDRLITELQKRDSESRYFDELERLANLSYETSDSLEPVAEALGLEVQTSDWIDRSGGILANPKVVAAAFSDEVLEEGINSDVIEPRPNGLVAVVLRVVEHEEPATKPLSEVRDRIVGILRDKRAADAATAKAAELAKAVGAGGDLATVSSGYEVEEPGLVARDAAQVPAQIRDYAFGLARPAKGKASYGSLPLSDGDAAAVVVSEVMDGSLKDLDEATRDQLSKGLAQGIGRSYYEDFLTDLESRARVERTPLAEGETAGD